MSASGITMGGSPMSDVAKMTGRVRRPNDGTLDLEIAIDDPKVYTRTFAVETTQNIEIDTELVDEFCLENEKSYARMQRSRATRFPIAEANERREGVCGVSTWSCVSSQP